MGVWGYNTPHGERVGVTPSQGAGVSERVQMLKKCERCGKAIESAVKLCYNLTILRKKETYYG